MSFHNKDAHDKVQRERRLGIEPARKATTPLGRPPRVPLSAIPPPTSETPVGRLPNPTRSWTAIRRVIVQHEYDNDPAKRQHSTELAGKHYANWLGEDHVAWLDSQPIGEAEYRAQGAWVANDLLNQAAYIAYARARRAGKRPTAKPAENGGDAA